ncbi:hypothetical protein [Pseudomonas protegens]|uniref:hypothetical protein n=1 Tax=Pseudomonas protegens TaxID=380021 RepID=UPI0015E8818E|nr:hypothetical protein [Pseudomonas protegens]
MQLIKSALTVAVCCIAAQAMAADGEINFTGSITANTCLVSVGDLNGAAGTNVSLGNAPSLSLKIGAAAPNAPSLLIGQGKCPC